MIKIINFIVNKMLGLLVEKDFIKKKINSKNAKTIIKLYSSSEYAKNFVKFRFWFGPILEVNKIVPEEGNILDIGSGESILANFLALSGQKRKIVGIEINKDRIKEADKGIKNIKFINGNIFKTPLAKSDAIIISHVLHHLGSKKKQIKLIKLLSKSLKKNGIIVIAEVNKEVSLSYLFGYITDIIFVPIFFEKKFLDLKIFHRSTVEWTKLFIRNDFRVVNTQITKGRIYPEVIFELKKDGK